MRKEINFKNRSSTILFTIQNLDLCCKPFVFETGNCVIHELPQKPDGEPGNMWIYDVWDIICTGIGLTYLEKGQWKIGDEDVKKISQLFNRVQSRDREELFQDFMKTKH